MRKASALFLLCAAFLLGCPKKGDNAEAGADAAPIVEAAAAAPEEDAAAAPVVVTAKNSGDVARFAGETLISDDDARLGQPTPARNAPKTGTVVATLKPNSDVHKIAEYQGSILVTFADPKDANTTLMGWIGKEAFNVIVVRKDAGAVDAAAPKPACPAGQVSVTMGKDPICKKKCTKDADCTKPPCGNMTSATGGVVRACPNDP